jgi:hypothetical protein
MLSKNWLQDEIESTQKEAEKMEDWLKSSSFTEPEAANEANVRVRKSSRRKKTLVHSPKK